VISEIELDPGKNNSLYLWEKSRVFIFAIVFTGQVIDQ
jgi:hypothetical protein